MDNIIDTIHQSYNIQNGTDFPLPTAAPPPSIKRTLRQHKNSFQDAIISTLQAQFDSIFSPNPFKIIYAGVPLKASLKSSILIDYRIQTLAEFTGGMSFPILYIKSEERRYGNNTVDINNHLFGKFKGYLLATKINWDMTFNIPNSTIDFNFKSESRPQNSFSDIKSESHAYRLMLESAFKNYALTVADGVGL